MALRRNRNRNEETQQAPATTPTPPSTSTDSALANALESSGSGASGKRVGKNEEVPGVAEQEWFVEKVEEKNNLAYIGRTETKLRFYLGRSSFHPTLANDMQQLVGKRLKLVSLDGDIFAKPEHFPREIRKAADPDAIRAEIEKLTKQLEKMDA